MIADLDELVTAAVTGLFSTMLHMQMAPVPVEPRVVNGQPRVAGAVAFIGRLTGVVYVHTTAAFARRLTATLLHLEASEVQAEEMINDTMGEIANMLVGQMKSRLADQGIDYLLTIPSVVRGSQFRIEATSSTEGRLFAFETQGKRLFVQFLLQPGGQTLN
jgi:chemotaxis protein CheX